MAQNSIINDDALWNRANMPKFNLHLAFLWKKSKDGIFFFTNTPKAFLTNVLIWIV